MDGLRFVVVECNIAAQTDENVGIDRAVVLEATEPIGQIDRYIGMKLNW